MKRTIRFYIEDLKTDMEIQLSMFKDHEIDAIYEINRLSYMANELLKLEWHYHCHPEADENNWKIDLMSKLKKEKDPYIMDFNEEINKYVPYAEQINLI